MRQSRNRIEAEIAPKLQPDVISDLRQDRRLQARALEQLRQFLRALGDVPLGLTEPKQITQNMVDHARRFDLSRRIHRAADDALRPDHIPLPRSGIDAFDTSVRILPLETMEVPPWQAVLRSDDGRIRAQQRLHLLGHFPSLMSLQSDDDIILMAEFGGIGRRGHPRMLLLAADVKLEAVVLDCFQMSAARNQRNIRSGELHQDAIIATDRSRTVDTNLHGNALLLRTTRIAPPINGIYRVDSAAATNAVSCVKVCKITN